MSGMRAVRRNFSGLERRRMEAARLLREGVWQAEVARRLKAGRLGRPRKLHQEQLRRVEKQLERGPQVMRSRKWTVRRVGELIERECRVRYCAAGAWGVLRGMGWKWRGGGRGWKRAPL